MPCRCLLDTGNCCTLRLVQRHEWQHGEYQGITLGTAASPRGHWASCCECHRERGWMVMPKGWSSS